MDPHGCAASRSLEAFPRGLAGVFGLRRQRRLPAVIRSLAVDANGALWACAASGLYSLSRPLAGIGAVTDTGSLYVLLHDQDSWSSLGLQGETAHTLVSHGFETFVLGERRAFSISAPATLRGRMAKERTGLAAPRISRGRIVTPRGLEMQVHDLRGRSLPEAGILR